MSEWLYGPTPGMIEPSVAPEFFISRIGGIELLKNNIARAYYCVDQLPLDSPRGGASQHVVQLKMLWPVPQLFSVMAHWGHALGTITGERETREHPDPGIFPRLVK